MAKRERQFAVINEAYSLESGEIGRTLATRVQSEHFSRDAAMRALGSLISGHGRAKRIAGKGEGERLYVRDRRTGKAYSRTGRELDF